MMEQEAMDEQMKDEKRMGVIMNQILMGMVFLTDPITVRECHDDQMDALQLMMNDEMMGLCHQRLLTLLVQPVHVQCLIVVRTFDKVIK